MNQEKQPEMIVRKANRITKWWLKPRLIPAWEGDMSPRLGEFYCPWWAKPLDFLYDLWYGRVVFDGK